MKDFRASLGCVLLVLGQLCLKSEIEINFQTGRGSVTNTSAFRAKDLDGNED